MILIEDNIKNKVNDLCASQFSSDDILDEWFVKMYRPFRIMQTVMGSCRVVVKDRVASAPSALQKCYTVILVVLMMYSTISLLQTYLINKFISDTIMIVMYTIGVFGVAIVCILNIIHTRFINNGENVKLYVRMQKIDRMMRMHDSVYKRNYKHITKVVLTITFLFLTLNLMTIMLVIGQLGILDIFGPTFVLTSFVVELIYCSNQITFFSIRVQLINSIITKHFAKENKGINTLSLRCANKNVKDEPSWMNFESCATDLYLNEIFSGFGSFQDLHKFQLLQFCISVVFWIILLFEYGIRASQNGLSLMFLYLDIIHIIISLCIKITVLLVICVRADIFLREIKETKKLSIFVLSRYSKGSLRKKAKAMLKLIESSTPCFSVYGMWSVDARLLLNMFTIVTTALVTILQLSYT